MSDARSYSVVVPVYNAEAGLDELLRRLSTVLAELPGPAEVILVNDGSSDGTWNVIRRLSGQYPWVRGISLTRNFGQHNALLAGIRRARGAVTVTLDDDLQHPPEEIPRLLDKLDENCDIVYGRPRTPQHPAWRRLASRAVKTTLQKGLGAGAAGRSSAFRAFRTDLRDGFASFSGANLSIDVLLSWTSRRATQVLVEHHRRMTGTSGYTLARLLRLTLAMVIGYSRLPLRIARFHFRTMGKPPYVIQAETGEEILTDALPERLAGSRPLQPAP